MRISIIVPSGDMVHADFAMSLTRMVVTTMSTGAEIMIVNPKSSLVQKGRWQGVKEALEQGADKIMFIDSDQTFPANALLRLLSHDLDIVGASYRLRQEKIEYTARNFDGSRIKVNHYRGLRSVASNGLGFTLIDVDIFKLLSEPWFEVLFENGKWISEDESFCFKVSDILGKTIWVDAGLTSEVGHIGTKVYI